MNTTNQSLDARGLSCPLPILKTRKALDAMNAGETLRVITTDPGSVQDIGSFCQQNGHALMSTHEAGNEHIFVIRKS